MSKYYVVHTVRMDRITYNQGEAIECNKETANSLLEAGAITKNAPPVSDVSEVKEDDESEFVNPFTRIELDDKIAKLLVDAGITDMDILSTCEAKKLEVIQGISKKKAKEIMDCFEPAE